jgi:hypothetical protein
MNDGGNVMKKLMVSEKEEVMVYGIGEAAEANGLSITIDKVASPDPDIFINGR